MNGVILDVRHRMTNVIIVPLSKYIKKYTEIKKYKLNNMIRDEYIKSETAKLLKEKGFDEKCDYCYASFDEDDIRVLELKPSIPGLSLMENRYPYVTQSVAMKWLREKHNLHIEARITNHSMSSLFEIVKYYWVVFSSTNAKWVGESSAYTAYFNTYEEAVEAGIKYCLENLI